MSYEQRLLRVIEYMHANPGGDMSLDTLADVAAMSRFHWHRVYRAAMGETCAQTVKRIRLHQAAVRLVQSEKQVAEIAASVGYPNLQSFTRAFSDAYGLPPAKFRKLKTVRTRLGPRYKGVNVMFDVEIREEPARRLAGIPHKGPYPEISQTFEKLSAIVSSRGLWQDVRGMVGVYYDDPGSVAADELRSFAAVAVTDKTKLESPLEEMRLPAGKHAVLRLKGPYSGLGEAYQHLYGTWLPSSGETPEDRPAFEMYLNSPMDTAPEELLTDITVPLK